MNLIWICSDTFRADHLACIGNPTIRTPCLDALAAQGVAFENAYVEGLPTGPERLVFHTGKLTLPFRGWSPLTDEDVTLCEILGQRGYRTAMISDLFHQFAPGANFHRGFHEWRWIRGQEGDKYVSSRQGIDAWKHFPENTKEIPDERKQKAGEFWKPLEQYLANVKDRKTEEDYFCAQTIRESMRWLDENQDAENFLLWVEIFDPHEPWDPPQKYYDMYADPNYDGPRIIAPWLHSLREEDFTPEQFANVKALYAAEVTLVDRWIGELLEKVDSLGLRDDTAIVFTSDHGTLLGERGGVTKNPKVRNSLCRSVANVPLIIRHPNGPQGARVKELVWTPDFMPTCCELLGIDAPPQAHGSSFWPLAQGDPSSAREFVVSGWNGKGYHYVTDLKWSFVDNNGVEPDEIYDLAEDPGEERNVASQHPEILAMMRERKAKFYEDAKSLAP